MAHGVALECVAVYPFAPPHGDEEMAQREGERRDEDGNTESHEELTRHGV